MGKEGKTKVEEGSASQAQENVPLLQEEAAANACEKVAGDSVDKALAQVEIEKRFALIKAWEDSEKTMADNKACKKLYATEAWENKKRAFIEVELKQIEEHFEKKRAAYVEIMKNKMAEIHKSAEEKRAVVIAKKGKDELKVEVAAEKFRATGNTPKKLFQYFAI